jgi:hypothetical protein
MYDGHFDVVLVLLKPGFVEYLVIAASRHDLVAQFDRIFKCNLSLQGSPIERMIDETTGRQDLDCNKFIEFVYRVIYAPLESHA